MLEWSIWNATVTTRSTSTSTASTSSWSLTGLFGITNNSGSTTGSSPVDEGDSTGRLLHLRSVLCPYKLRFAMTLADVGLTSAALEYAKEAQVVVGLCSEASVAAASAGDW